ncbi:MAG TPA: ATPase [Planctomycetaceae bacterium]|nr:ATPase [Planctomycetaceae bacterium]
MPKELKLLIQAGHPLIFIESSDEIRALKLISQVSEELTRSNLCWSMTEGLTRIPDYVKDNRELIRPDQVLPPGKAQDVLQHLIKNPQKGIYVFKDLGPHCKDALVHRLMRDLMQIASKEKMTLIMLDALAVPDEIKRFAFRYELGWPSVQELEEVVRETYQKIREESFVEVNSNLRRRDMDQLVQSLRGLSCCQASRVVASVIYDDHHLDGADLPRIIEGKRQLLSSTGCLESIAADFSPDDIGGLTNLKTWLAQRRDGFSPKAIENGLESPRGVLMLGIPGCGKSLCAKVVAADWGMPLLRLDPGVLYQKFIGESESQLRQALRQAEAMAPVVLWIDEIEKAFASASAASADGGLSKRMFGSLLSWMQDHRHPIFLVATANDISALPPELMRKGRFDEVFFVDLPDKEARKHVLKIHLKRRKMNPKGFDLDELADHCEEFSGSELEQVVISAKFAAHQENTPLADKHLIQEMQNTRPLAMLSAEKVRHLRQWAVDRCVSAD